MRYRMFGERTGLRVSELALGAGTFGTRWGYGAEPEEARRIFDRFAEAGGNFVDCADAYQFGQAETLLGQFVAADRDHFVLATKYTLGAEPEGGVSRTGNGRKNMVRSVEASLKRLATDRIDLYWAHMADGTTPTEEIARGFEDLVRAGKVLHVGLSDFPAWRDRPGGDAGRAARLGPDRRHPGRVQPGRAHVRPRAAADGRGARPRGDGLVAPGRRPALRQVPPRRDRPADGLGHPDPHRARPARGGDPGRGRGRRRRDRGDAGPGRVAWVRAKGLFPILGPRTPAQLEDNLGALGVDLTGEQVRRLDEASAVPLGFPHDFLASERNRARLAGGRADLLERPARAVA